MHSQQLLPLSIIVGNPKAFGTFVRLRCQHVADTSAQAYGVTVKRLDTHTEIRIVCSECARAFSEEMAHASDTCDYCGKMVPLDRLMQWMPKTASADRGDKPMLVCPSCAVSSASLREDAAYDEVMFQRQTRSQVNSKTTPFRRRCVDKKST